MSYATLLTIITGSTENLPGRGSALEVAAALARRRNAHLDVLALGVDHTQIGYYYPGAGPILYQETLQRAQDDAAALADAARARLTGETLRWSIDSAVAQLGGLSALVAQSARFADLAVLPRPYGEGRAPEDEAVIEAALFDAGCPVLAIPPGLAGATVDGAPRMDRVVVAWNQSSESLATIRRALPLLREAAMVNIAVIDPPRHGPERSDPGGMLSQWLSRHGVRSEVSVLARTMPRVSDVLQRHLTDQAADLLVMGAYGHSRFREAILGGTTRNLLEQADIPVFLAR